jgi:hypothetical protein
MMCTLASRSVVALALVGLAGTAGRAGLAHADEKTASPTQVADASATTGMPEVDPDAPRISSDGSTMLEPLPGKPRKEHKALALGTLGGLYVGAATWAYFAWYKDHPANHGFECCGDGLFEKTAYAGGSDKLGHAMATMVAARVSSQMLRYGGWKRRPAALIGSGLAAAAFTLVEYQDAYYYEFSMGDLAADYLGAAAAALLETNDRADELFDFRLEYFPSTEYRAILNGDRRPAGGLDIKKVNFAEDYSGQRFLLALHLKAFHSLDDDKWSKPLRYVDAVVGFHSDKYRPAPDPDENPNRTQELFVGVSLNLQAVFDDLLAPGRTRTALHGVTEVFNAPFTSIGLGSTSRSCPAPECMVAP